MPSRFSIQNVFRHDLTTFHAIRSPVRALNPIGFPNTTGSDRDDMRHLPCNHEPHSSIKSARIPKYNAKRII
ncbi:uncharacterized protein G2W53_039708 [Senna tora]|uniref:Uncharacterized protein n=1 Tax=Senna tora TaxID=362788 RepID=A0A834W306_9FABA|nr:uncharacterized protein G2W53_039708 [Senna tora]